MSDVKEFESGAAIGEGFAICGLQPKKQVVMFDSPPVSAQQYIWDTASGLWFPIVGRRP